jgi:hypothetical protein
MSSWSFDPIAEGSNTTATQTKSPAAQSGICAENPLEVAEFDVIVNPVAFASAVLATAALLFQAIPSTVNVPTELMSTVGLA